MVGTSRRTLLPALLLVFAAAACEPASWLPTRENPDYCDETTPCPTGQLCDVATRACQPFLPDLAVRECEASAACPSDRPLCQAGRCRACAGAADDDGCRARDPLRPRCLAAGTCGGCREDGDCAGAAPVCGSDNACRGCRKNAECKSGVCRDDGACVPEAEIAFVDNGGKTTGDCLASGVHDGKSPATAYCDVQAAIDAADPRPVIRIVRGRYGAFKISRSNVRIVGPGAFDGFGPGEYTISTSVANRPAISIAIDATIVATVEDLRVGSLSTARAIDCSALSMGTRLSLRRVHAASPQGTAVFAGLQCSLALDDTRVTGSQTGVEVFGAPVAIVRSTIDANRLGVSITDGSFGRVFPSDVTVDASQLRGNDTALQCGDTSSCRIANSVIAGNGLLARGLGGPVFDTAGTALVDFSTIAGNLTTAGASGAGVTCRRPATVRNSILYGNRALGGTQAGAACALVATVTGTGDKAGILKDPAFIAFDQLADLRLKPGNPQNRDCCIDKAQPQPGAAWNDHDADGRKRPLGGGHDVGAFEAE